jgi:hypothetical protein
MLKERPGNVVVISGKNRSKLERVQKSLEAGLHVLVDKPWILEASELPALEKALATADQKGLVAYDIMTERFEVTTELQKELVNDRQLRQLDPRQPSRTRPCTWRASTTQEGGRRRAQHAPVWFFDTAEQARASTTSGRISSTWCSGRSTPSRRSTPRKDFQLVAAQRWPTMIPLSSSARSPAADFPENIKRASRTTCSSTSPTAGDLQAARQRREALVIWDWEASHGDTHYAFYQRHALADRGAARLEGALSPELYVVPAKRRG